MRTFASFALTAFLLAPAAAQAARDDWGISVGVDLGAQGSGWVESEGVSPAGGGLIGAWAEWQPIPVLALRGGLRLGGEAGQGSARGTLVGELGPVGTYWFGPLRLHAGSSAARQGPSSLLALVAAVAWAWRPMPGCASTSRSSRSTSGSAPMCGCRWRASPAAGPP